MARERETLKTAWDAYIAPTERITLDQADGRIAASIIRQYPPGVPDIIPGMQYSTETIRGIKNAHARGVQIIGVDMETDREVEVLIQAKTKANRPDIQTFDSQTISDSTINEIADYFRTGFTAAPYFHFAFHESDPLQSLPHTLDFDAYIVSTALSDPEKRRACQEALLETAYQRALRSEDKIDVSTLILPKGFHIWTDKELCRKHIKDRLSDPGYVTLVRCPETKKMLGLYHSRVGSVKRIYETEEWSNPLLFSRFQDETIKDDPERFYKKIGYHFGLKPYDQIITISAQILSPEIQGQDTFYKMMRSMACVVKPEHTELPLLAEIPPHGTAHVFNTAFTERLIFGVLKNDHPVVFSSQLSQTLFPFVSEKAYWHHMVKTKVRNKRIYEKKFYIPLPTDSAHVTIRPNGKLGLAVFATDDIPANTRIAVFTGETYQSDTALGLPDIMRDHAIQIGAKEYVFGYKGLAHCLCHSCDPNCGIRNFTEIFTIRDILKGEQLSWDYRCSENSNWVLDECLCGAERCTGRVENFESLPSQMKAEYISKSMVSEWILSTLSS